MIQRRTVLLFPLLAAGCGGGDVSPGVFDAPDYSYLTKLRLNVAAVEIDDRTPPANAVEALAPLRPVDALKQMAHDRLLAGGTVGRAVLVIDAASLTRSGGDIDGRLAVHLDIYTGGVNRVGFAEAQVSRRRVGPDSASRAVLYAFVNQMMDDMNVELEFQVRRSLKEYLQETEGAAPTPPPVQQQDLTAPSPQAAAPKGSAAGHVLVRP